MELRDYLHFERKKVKEFAEECDYSPTHMSAIIRGRLKPSRKLMKIIERVTHGKVTVTDWH